MYNVPQNIDKRGRILLLIDSITLVVLILTIIVWVYIADRRWYGIYPKDLSGLELNLYTQWQHAKYIELGLSIALAGYTLYKRRVLTILKRICLLLLIGLVWVYWIRFQ